MIEVFNKKHKIIGYIDGKKYLNKKKKLLGFLEENTVKNKNSFPLFNLDSHNIIRSNNGSQHGFIFDSKISDNNGELFTISKETGEILDFNGEIVLYLEGDLEKVGDLDFLGISTIFLKSLWSERLFGVKFI